MSLDNENHLCLDVDAQNILETLLNSDDILKYLLMPPSSSTHDVLLEDSIVDTKTIGERFNQYYLSDDPLFVNWRTFPDETLEVHGRICFFPGKLGLSGATDKSDYVFDIFLPYEWHKKTNVGFKVLRKLIQLFKDTHLFGNIGKVDFSDATPILNIKGYVGYTIYSTNWNFVQ